MCFCNVANRNSFHTSFGDRLHPPDGQERLHCNVADAVLPACVRITFATIRPRAVTAANLPANRPERGQFAPGQGICCTMRFFHVFLALALMAGRGLCADGAAQAEARGAPDVLILGDSQLTFGAGAAFVDLMRGMAGTCGLAPNTSTGVIGVRSSAITSWTGRTKSAKSAICDVDPKWRVNAGAYGTLSQGENPYVQIGQGAQFQFCGPDRSPLQAVFRGGYYAPELVIFFMMGNAADRWADSPAAALSDVQALMADLPPDQPCLFMTSAPPHGAKVVRLRQRAQDNLARAFARSGSHCSFVPGFTEQTVRENQGNAANFRRKPSGKVKDPFHPTEAAARKFLGLQKGALCRAITRQLGKS